MVSINDLVGMTFTDVRQEGDERLVFVADSGRTFEFYHSQDCCETVSIEDVVGDLTDLVGSPLVRAEERASSNENPEGVPAKEYQVSWTWTFYEFATNKGSVTVRWYGESNGYYSESVDFHETSRSAS